MIVTRIRGYISNYTEKVDTIEPLNWKLRVIMIVVTCCNGDCHYDNLPCVQWRQSWHFDKPRFSHHRWLHRHCQMGLYSLKRRRLTGIVIPIINLRRSYDRLRFIIGITAPIRWCLLYGERSSTSKKNINTDGSLWCYVVASWVFIQWTSK